MSVALSFEFDIFEDQCRNYAIKQAAVNSVKMISFTVKHPIVNIYFLSNGGTPKCREPSKTRKVIGSSASKWWLRASCSIGHSVITCANVSST